MTLVRRRFASAFALLRRDELAGQVGKTVPKDKVGNDDIAQKTIKKQANTLFFNDLM